MNTNNVWLVTGASKGLGLSLVKKLLAKGYRVIATSRTIGQLIQQIGDPSENFLPLQMTITDNEDVKKVIKSGVEHFGRIDVVVNNAGYGQIGTLEELSDEEVKNNFEVNVYGSVNVIRNVMPYMRAQHSGHVFNIASIGGFSGGFAGWGIYCATKFAVAGLTESFAQEVQAFGINATVVYPGYFRTDFLSQDSVKIAANPIEAYEAARQSEELHLKEINGNQPNDPEKAADVLIEVALLEKPPVHLFLGADAYDTAYQKISLVQKDMAYYQALGTSTAII